MPDTEWTTEDVLYLPLERCTERACTKRHYSELTDDENTRWHPMSSVHLTSLAAHDAEVAAKALEDAAEGMYAIFASGRTLGTASDLWLRARAAALRGGGHPTPDLFESMGLPPVPPIPEPPYFSAEEGLS